MTPSRFNVFFAFFSYSGNGGFSSCHPSLRTWFAKTLSACKNDERIGDIIDEDYSDTPITMTRNQAVWDAQQAKADVLVMIDSDQYPDYELDVHKDKLARPFWDSSFDFFYRRKTKGLLTVVGAPYCGPPPFNNVYVFRWANWNNYSPDGNMRIEPYTREEAAIRIGFEEVAALPTGLILFDVDVFDLVEPPYFYYEWTDKYQRQKASTEDVTCTRDISLHCQIKKGYNPVFCNWDAWAGHWKPLCVDKPRLLHIDQVGEKYRQAIQRNQPSRQRLTFVGEGNG